MDTYQVETSLSERIKRLKQFRAECLAAHWNDMVSYVNKILQELGSVN